MQTLEQQKSGMDVVEDVFEDELVCTICSELFVKVRNRLALQFAPHIVSVHT